MSTPQERRSLSGTCPSREHCVLGAFHAPGTLSLAQRLCGSSASEALGDACQASAAGGEHVVDFLGRYIHRTALCEQSLLSCDSHGVTFRYRDSRDGQRKTMSLPGEEFLRRYLQHVLPRAIHQVRSFGLLHPSKRVTLRRLQLMLVQQHHSLEK